MGHNTRKRKRNRGRESRSSKESLKMSEKFVLTLMLCVFAGRMPLAAQNVSAIDSTTMTGEGSSIPVAHPLQIAAGDLLEVRVFDTPELSCKLRVDEHGAVTLPL